MVTTFSNVTISIEAENETEAYNYLCAKLDDGTEGRLEYTTDTFSTDTDPQNDRDTSELWPKED